MNYIIILSRVCMSNKNIIMISLTIEVYTAQASRVTHYIIQHVCASYSIQMTVH